MRKGSMSLGTAIGLLVIGILLGSVFTFGMQYINADVTRESCDLIETQFVSYDEIRHLRRPMKIKEIAIDCADDKRYFIDGVSINTELINALSELSQYDEITLLIHPNSNTILELSSENANILMFDDTISKLGGESTRFLFLGAFMYLCSLVGLYYIVLHIIKKRKIKKQY